MKERLTTLSALQTNLNNYITHISEEPLLPDQQPPHPTLGHLLRQFDDPQHLSEQNKPQEENPKKVE